MIEATPTHPLWVEGKGWVAADSLVAGDLLKLKSGDFAAVKNIDVAVLNAPIVVYNFEVEGFHTYFVSGKQVLVHNACSEHTKNARKSTKNKHQKGMSRKQKDHGGEKGDARRKPNPNKRRR